MSRAGKEEIAWGAAQHQRIKDFVWAADKRGMIVVIDEGGDEQRSIHYVDLETGDRDLLSPESAADSRLVGQYFDGQLHVLAAVRGVGEEGYRLADIALGAASEWVEGPEGPVYRWIPGYARGQFAALAKVNGRLKWLVHQSHGTAWQEIPTISALGGFRPLAFSRNDGSVYSLCRDASGNDSLYKTDLDTGNAREICCLSPFDVTRVIFNAVSGAPEMVSDSGPGGMPHALNEWAERDAATLASLLPADTVRWNVVSQAARKWIVEVHSQSEAPRFFLFDRSSGSISGGNSPYPSLAHTLLYSRRGFWCASADGMRLQGFLTVPDGDPPWPAVILVHGGPWHRDQPGFDPDAQLIAAAGALCIQVNYRGSTGRGQRFVDQGDRQWGRLMQDDLIAALRHAIDQGLADPQRIVAKGTSYGGYAAAMLNTNREVPLAGAVAISSPYDIVDMISWAIDRKLPGAGEYLRRIGHPVDDRESLLKISPVSNVKRMGGPLLLIHGERDARIPVRQLDEMAKRLTRAGVCHHVLRIPGEGHAISSPPRVRMINEAVASFLRDRLGLEPSAVHRAGI